VGGRSARIKARPVREGPLRKVWRVGLGGESRRMKKKFMKGKIWREKIVHSEQPKQNSCIDLPKYIT